MTAGRRRPAHKTRCERCRRLTHSILKSRNICSTCHHAERSTVCRRCAHPFHPLSPSDTLCLQCSRVVARPAPVAVSCPGCKRFRVPHLVGSQLCQACWRAQLYGYDDCIGCGRERPIYLKTEKLCAYCYKDRMAGQALRLYVERYACPFPLNRRLFHRLVAALDWTRVRERDNRRLHNFGKFLQQQEIISPLSWEQLFALMPPLPPTRRNIPKGIRRCLLDLGHLCAASGEIEPYQAYRLRRGMLAPIAVAPPRLQPLLQTFTDWLLSRQMKPSAIRHHLEAVAKFWRWCAERSIQAPHAVHAALITAYLLELHWQWRCRRCDATMYCANDSEPTPLECRACHCLNTLRRVLRYSPNSIRRIRASLFIFFQWATLARRSVANPVQCKVLKPEARIQHYPTEILPKIARYIVAADADPTAALMLYLIIFHLATVYEVRHLRVPETISLTRRVPESNISGATHFILPRRQPSLGIVHVGRRPTGQLPLHDAAVPWLRPLLVRFEVRRLAVAGTRCTSRYVFVSPRGSIRDLPISPTIVWQAVTDASRSVVGYPCNPRTLRKTAAVYFADRIGAGILSRMGWEAQQAFAYTWMTREVLNPIDPL